MSDPWQWWDARSIADATQCPLANVQEHWPRVFDQLGRCMIQEPDVGIGVMGTLAIEGDSTFEPVREGCYLGEPEPAETHRKTLSYYPYYGRGHVQLTHSTNYERYGPKVAQLWGRPSSQYDLLSNPDLALDPDVAAAVIALWFRDTRALPSASYPEGYTLIQACQEEDWGWVRRFVYGGNDPSGTARIQRIAQSLGPPANQPILSDVPKYNPLYPAIAQNDDWSCAPTSARWMLWAYGRQTSEQWMENSLLSQQIVTTANGLEDATGGELANWLTREYREFGYRASNDAVVSFDQVAQEANERKHPLCMGGRVWYHWTGVRGYDGDKLLLANPSPGWGNIGQSMTRDEFRLKGPFSLVRLTHPRAESPDPQPPVDPEDPFKPWLGKVGSGLLEMMATDQTLPAQRRSTWLPLGDPAPSDIESCYGQNGTLYYWLITTGRGYRTRPS